MHKKRVYSQISELNLEFFLILTSAFIPQRGFTV